MSRQYRPVATCTPGRLISSSSSSSSGSSSDSTNLERTNGQSTIYSYQWLVLILSILSICVSLVVISVAITVYIQREEEISQYQRVAPIACVECVKLQRGNGSFQPLIDKLSRHAKNGQDMCCASTSQQMSTLIELSMKRKKIEIELPHHNASGFYFSPVSAHMQVHPPIPHQTPNHNLREAHSVPTFDESLVCLFKNVTDALVEHVRGVEMAPDKSNFQVTQPGMYQIYSSTLFSPLSIFSCQHFEFKTWSMFIKRQRLDYPTDNILLTTVHTCCNACTHQEESKFTSGVFDLRESDNITVEIQARGLVYFEKETTFVGLFKLGAD